MKMLLRLVSAALLVLLSFAPLSAEQAGHVQVTGMETPGRVIIDASFVRFYGFSSWGNHEGHIQYLKNAGEWLQRDKPDANNVLIYNTYRGYGYNNDYFTLGYSSLKAAGFTVTQTSRLQIPELNKEVLSGYDQLWVLNGQTNSKGGFSEEELAAVMDFHKSGKGLFLITDHSNRVNGWDVNWSGDVNQITAFWSVELQGFVDNYTQWSVAQPTFDTEHPLWDNVDTVVGGTDSEIVTDNPDVHVIAGIDSNPMIAVIDPVLPIEVSADIKPGSCPNPVNVNNKGVLSLAIAGTVEFDAHQLDPASIRLEGVAPLRTGIEDAATPFPPSTEKDSAFACTEEGSDGLPDLVMKFKTQEVVAAIESATGRALIHGETFLLTITGTLKEEYGGAAIIGEDVIWIRNKGK